MKNFVLFLILISVFICCNSSSGRSEIEETIYSAVSAAEERDVKKFMKFISIDYLDADERTREDIEEKVKTYVNRFRVISVNILNIETVNNTVDSADVIAEISFSSGIGKVLSKIANSYGEVYRFSILMSRQGREWVVKNAKWEWMSLSDIYPESLKVLKELFPATF